MAKGIIVVEMPEKCADCPIEVHDETSYGEELCHRCSLKYKGYTGEIRDSGKLDWCPIRPTPRVKSGDRKYLNEYEKGWNDCVDYLEGRNG